MLLLRSSMPPHGMLGLLLVLLLLGDADSTCPIELDPPEIVGEYGKSYLVNCNSTAPNHTGMYWTDGNRKHNLTEDVGFLSERVSLSDWNGQLQCNIQLNETYNCSEGLLLTVYQNPDSVILYQVKYLNSVEEGTLYQLQCDITNVTPVQNLKVTWYKNNQTIKTDSFTNTSKMPQHESSSLMMNLSREDNGVPWRCEARLDFGPQGPQLPAISSEILSFSVHYAPAFKSTVDIVDVAEGENVSLDCDAEGNPPPIFQWTYDAAGHNKLNISENNNYLRLERMNNSITYYCTAKNSLGNRTKQIYVNVRKTSTAAMTTPVAKACPLKLTPAKIVVKYGDPASVNCSTSSTDHAGMGWEAAQGSTGFEEATSVTWKVEKLEDWAMEPRCYITLNDDDQCIKKLNITLYKTPDIVSMSLMNHNGPLVEGTEYQLECNIVNVAPVQNLKVKWYKDNEIIETRFFDEYSMTPENKSSSVRIIPRRVDNNAAFRCEAQLDLGPDGPQLVPTKTSEPYIANVHYAPEFKQKDYTIEVTKGENVSLVCSAEGNPSPSLHWNYTFAANVKETTRGSQRNISVTGATSTNAGVYICLATNKFGNVTNSATLIVKDPAAAISAVVILVIVIVLLVISIIILTIICRNYRKKHGQYNLTPFGIMNGFEAVPMTPQSASNHKTKGIY